ncbi:hypothetical protein CIZ89_000627 [Escherichia coli]|uniref:type II secretion system protein GspL n=1 Tax=Escherichia coli TaxID=562 RepID=UPI0017971E46|nr:hypothetical protein [Escherichia coli]EFH6483939.1 hypothetical protein [Escherichia coli]EFH6583266.1 hypothetical protein [Escherichia coli]EGM5998181.1 hypothetical protein [Escherichia coli]HAV2422066.1 hypothetical protein [Escherichia coli]
MSSILEIFFPLCASDTVRWQRRTPDVEHGIWPDVADEQLQQWLQTDAIRLYIPGEWISVWQVELPDVARKQIPTILPALLEEELNQDIDELHFAPLNIDQQLATVLLILVALAVERGVTLWSVSEQVAQSRTQAEEQFLTLFPEQKRIVNLRSQVTMALKKYRPQADDTRLLAELSAIASTLKSASLSDIEMRGFTFDQKRQILHLQLRAANFASFDKLRSALATDYVVQQDALQKEGDAVSGGVTLRRK